jgi:naphthalene 1,2-dioxygenase system ferredoxin subunit
MNHDNGWLDAADESDVPDDDVIGVDVAGRDIALYRVEGSVFATDNICTHGHARLCDGFLDGHEIECPLHQGKFDIRNGSATCAPATDALRCYPVRVERGRVLLQLPG